MKCYYFLFDNGGYVLGCLVPQATDERDAIRQLRYSISMKWKDCRDDLHHNRRGHIHAIRATLRRPWQLTKPRFDKRYRKLKVVELTKPLDVGYWLENIQTGEYVCNLVQRPGVNPVV